MKSRQTGVMDLSKALVTLVSSYKETVFLQGVLSKLATTSYEQWSLHSLKEEIASVWGAGFLSHQSYAYTKEDWIFLYVKHMPSLEAVRGQRFFEELLPQEKIFELVMGDFEFMKPRIGTLHQLVRQLQRPSGFLELHPLVHNLRLVLAERMKEFLLVSMGETPPSSYEILALSLFYIRCFWVFMNDSTQDLSPTMVSVNEGLGLLKDNFKNRFSSFQEI